MTFDKFFCATEVLKFVYRAFDLRKWTSGEHQNLSNINGENIYISKTKLMETEIVSEMLTICT